MSLAVEGSLGGARRPSRSDVPPGLKLAEITAMEIERELAAAGWPEGRLLGTEPELQARFGVSRAVLREAIRLLEHHGVATMRRGGAGGLITARPTPAAAVRPSEIYLEWAGVDSVQLVDARAPLELAVVRLATGRLSEEDAQRLRECVAAEARFLAGGSPQEGTVEFDASLHDIHLVLADISGNPALRLFIEVLTKLTHANPGASELFMPGSTAKRPRKLIDEVHHSHQRIVEAVITGDASLASRRMLKHLEAMQGGLRSA